VVGTRTSCWKSLPEQRFSERWPWFLAEHPELDVEWLPKYAPDLNPEEGCHGNVKGRLSNATPETEEEIRPQADRGFARLRRRPDILLGFFHHAGLRVKRLT
jgi:transposase